MARLRLKGHTCSVDQEWHRSLEGSHHSVREKLVVKAASPPARDTQREDSH